jgi:predicted Mrr-cat superfamily restriction endonuclease
MASWIVRAGSDDQYLDDVLAEGIAAIGWKELRGKVQIKGVEFNDLYHKLQQIYSNESNHTVGAFTSQIHAFGNKMFGGDFILIPSGKGKKISVGYLVGDIVEEPSNSSYLATRRVVWLTKLQDRQFFFEQVNGTSAFENPRTVVQTAINHQDIRKYVEKVTGDNFWKLIGEANLIHLNGIYSVLWKRV